MPRHSIGCTTYGHPVPDKLSLLIVTVEAVELDDGTRQFVQVAADGYCGKDLIRCRIGTVYAASGDPLRQQYFCRVWDQLAATGFSESPDPVSEPAPSGFLF